MRNKNVGFLIVGISIVMALIVLGFNIGFKKIVAQTCFHGEECSMYNTISIQTWTSLSIVGLIFIIGLFLVFSKPDEKIIVRKIKEKKKKLNLTNLEQDEKKIITLLQKENGGMFQRDLMEKLEIGKVKTTRVLDKLESKGLIERKRRGMNNLVLLKI
jgi:uncharacterized membrane protein